MRHFIAVFLLSCGASHMPPSQTPSAELTPAFASVEPWLGDWRGASGSEHWAAANGAMFGVWFHDGDFTVLVVDDGDAGKPADGALRFITIPSGMSSTERRDSGSFTHVHDYDRVKHESAPELEAADRAFAADVAARGADGWRAAFDPHGGMLQHDKRVEGDEIRDAMAPLLLEGLLAWAPIASGKSGELGFTVGKATFKPNDPKGESFASCYITIWRRQPDGHWKVLFDTGRMVNPPSP